MKRKAYNISMAFQKKRENLYKQETGLRSNNQEPYYDLEANDNNYKTQVLDGHTSDVPYYENNDVPYFEAYEVDDIYGIDRNLEDYGNVSDEGLSVEEEVSDDLYTCWKVGCDVNHDIDKAITQIQLYRASAKSMQTMMGLQKPYEDSPYTTAQFQQAFMNVGRTFGVNQHAQEKYMRVLIDHLPKMNLFVNPLIEDTNSLSTLLYKYCENDCMVFAGESQNIRCTTCFNSRMKTLYYRPIT